MARTARLYDLTSKTKRRKCPPRAKPYFASIENKLTLGYISRWPASGVWVARRETGRVLSESNTPYATYEQWRIAQADDVSPANSTDVLTFEQAKARAASQAQTRVGGGRRRGALTVRGAVTSYLSNLEAQKGKRARVDAENRLNKHALPLLGATDVGKLTLTQLRDWLNRLVKTEKADPDRERRSKDTANRILSTLKAALNFAFQDEQNGIVTDKAWRALKGFKDVGRSREDHFTEAEVLTLIDSARNIDPCFADLLEATFYTGARAPGELSALDARHFDAGRRQLQIVSGKTGPRITTLTQEGVLFFKRVTEGKKPTDILLPNSNGERWGKSGQHRPMKLTLAAAGLPLTAGIYTLRHTYISRAIERGMPLTLIADNVGTSLRMIEQNYAKSIAQTRRDIIEQMGPTLRKNAT